MHIEVSAAPIAASVISVEVFAWSYNDAQACESGPGSYGPVYISIAPAEGSQCRWYIMNFMYM